MVVLILLLKTWPQSYHKDQPLRDNGAQGDESVLYMLCPTLDKVIQFAPELECLDYKVHFAFMHTRTVRSVGV